MTAPAPLPYYETWAEGIDSTRHPIPSDEVVFEVSTKRRVDGEWVTLTRPIRVRVRLEGDTIRIHADEHLILAMPSGNQIELRARMLGEVE